MILKEIIYLLNHRKFLFIIGVVLLLSSYISYSYAMEDNVYIKYKNIIQRNNDYKIVLENNITSDILIDKNSIYLNTEGDFYVINKTNGNINYKLHISGIKNIEQTNNFIYLKTDYIIYKINKISGVIVDKQIFNSLIEKIYTFFSIGGLHYEINNTNLAPTIPGHTIGTGERISGVTYYTNSSQIELFVFAHASSVSQTAEIHLYINGTKVADTSGRPLGNFEESNKTVVATIPENSNYMVEFINSAHYEWREYNITSDGTGSNDITYIVYNNFSSYNQTYDSNISKLQSNDTYQNTTLNQLQTNDTYFNGTIFPLSTNFKNDTLGNKIIGLQTNDTYFNSSLFNQSGNFRNDSINDTIIRNYTSHIKVGSFTRDISLATGTQVITGIGFKPSGVIFFAVLPSTSQASWGMDDGVTSTSSVLFPTSLITNDGTASINIFDGVSKDYGGKVQSFDSDGFTISWIKTGSPTGTATIRYMAYR